METLVAFGELARRFPQLKVADGAPEHNPSISFSRLARVLPVVAARRASLLQRASGGQTLEADQPREE